MYAPTSTNSPRFGPISGDDGGLTDFDGAGEILRAWGNGLRPDPDLTVSEWADRHRMLSGRASAEPGRYRTVRTPYMREIMDRLSPGDPTQRIVFMKAAQVGATEAGNNWIGFAIHQAPGPMLAVQPTVDLAKRNSRQRIDPLIDESPELRERVKPARSRDAGNTMLSKEFAGGILIMTGANSAVGLRSTPARYIFLDEVDAYPASADEEGDPVTLAEALPSDVPDAALVLAAPLAAETYTDPDRAWWTSFLDAVDGRAPDLEALARQDPDYLAADEFTRDAVLARVMARLQAQQPRIDPATVPHHVGVILDGNRRWAKSMGFGAAQGHKRGADKIEEFLGWARAAGVRIVTLWLLSTDNLSRDPSELAPLLDIIADAIDEPPVGEEQHLIGAAGGRRHRQSQPAGMYLPEQVHRRCRGDLLRAAGPARTAA